MNLAVLCMQKNEGEWLMPWFNYYKKLFGEENIYLFDNGSDDIETLETLNFIKKSNANLILDFNDNCHFNDKGNILLKYIMSIEIKYDYYYFVDADEFLILLINGEISYSPEKIEEYISGISNSQGKILRIDKSIYNIPNSYFGHIDYNFTKKFILKSGFDNHLKIDRGFHLFDHSKSEEVYKDDVVKTNLSFIHLHNKNYSEKRKRSKYKLTNRVDYNNVDELLNYRGAGSHLIHDLLMNESEYYDRFKKFSIDINLENFYRENSINYY